jgi:choline dehydrogenase-like flavoprotein
VSGKGTIHTSRDYDQKPLELEAEVVVVGTGAGGAAAAAVLAERGLDVLMLEEGGHYERKDFTAVPLEMTKLLYRDNGMTTVLGLPGTPSFPLPMGRCVGGSTTINSGTCFRVPPRVVESWRRELGVASLTFDSLVPWYERVERDIHVEAPPLEKIGKNALLMHRGAKELGVRSGVIPRNAKGCRGSGVCAFGCPTDAKQSTLLAYVPRALAAGARLFADVRVERVLAERERAKGVEGVTLDRETRAPRGKVTVRAPVVVVACGTALTPVLLTNSKVGNSSGQLGRNLRVHPAAKVMALFREEVRCWEGVPQSYYVDEWHDEGILLEGIAVPPALGAVSLPYAGREHAAIMERYDHLGSWGVMVSDVSHGRVRPALRQGGFPICTYQLARDDARKVIVGLARCAELAFAAGAEVVHTGIHDVPALRRPEDVEKMLRAPIKPEDLELIAFHPLGTARMGPSAGAGVVDPWLEAHDVDGLFVADGSVFPTSLEVNPQLTIMAFAVRTAEHIASKREKYVRK